MPRGREQFGSDPNSEGDNLISEGPLWKKTEELAEEELKKPVRTAMEETKERLETEQKTLRILREGRIQDEDTINAIKDARIRVRLLVQMKDALKEGKIQEYQEFKRLYESPLEERAREEQKIETEKPTTQKQVKTRKEKPQEEVQEILKATSEEVRKILEITNIEEQVKILKRLIQRKHTHLKSLMPARDSEAIQETNEEIESLEKVLEEARKKTKEETSEADEDLKEAEISTEEEIKISEKNRKWKEQIERNLGLTQLDEIAKAQKELEDLTNHRDRLEQEIDALQKAETRDPVKRDILVSEKNRIRLGLITRIEEYRANINNISKDTNEKTKENIQGLNTRKFDLDKIQPNTQDPKYKDWEEKRRILTNLIEKNEIVPLLLIDLEDTQTFEKKVDGYLRQKAKTISENSKQLLESAKHKRELEKQIRSEKTIQKLLPSLETLYGAINKLFQENKRSLSEEKNQELQHSLDLIKIQVDQKEELGSAFRAEIAQKDIIQPAQNIIDEIEKEGVAILRVPSLNKTKEALANTKDLFEALGDYEEKKKEYNQAFLTFLGVSEVPEQEEEQNSS